MADPKELPDSLHRESFPSRRSNVVHNSSPLPPDNCTTAANTSGCPQREDASAIKDCGQLEGSMMEKECSMCGDTGIHEDLFRCTRCHHRYQHIYCSRSYPNLGSEKWICNWCLHEDDKIQQDKELKQNVKRKAEEIGDGSDKKSPSSPVKDNSEPKTDRVVYASKESDLTIRTQVPKRQRCNHPIEKTNITVEKSNVGRWRHVGKNRLQLNSSRGIAGRRYKLLADVLC